MRFTATYPGGAREPGGTVAPARGPFKLTTMSYPGESKPGSSREAFNGARPSRCTEGKLSPRSRRPPIGRGQMRRPHQPNTRGRTDGFVAKCKSYCNALDMSPIRDWIVVNPHVPENHEMKMCGYLAAEHPRPYWRILLTSLVRTGGMPRE